MERPCGRIRGIAEAEFDLLLCAVVLLTPMQVSFDIGVERKSDCKVDEVGAASFVSKSGALHRYGEREGTGCYESSRRLGKAQRYVACNRLAGRFLINLELEQAVDERHQVSPSNKIRCIEKNLDGSDIYRATDIRIVMGVQDRIADRGAVFGQICLKRFRDDRSPDEYQSGLMNWIGWTHKRP